MQEFLGYFIPGISAGMVYALIALGFVLIYKCSGILNLAQGELVLFGAYVFFLCSNQFGLPLWAALLLTLLLAAFLGIVVERFALRPLIGQPILSLIVATLGLGVLLRGVMILVWGAETLTLPRLFPIGSLSIAGVPVAYEHLLFLITSLVLLGILLFYFRYTAMGLAMIATADAQQAAQSVGVKVSAVLRMSWIISSIVAAVGGILLTSITGLHYSAVGIGLRAIAVVLLGGLESIPGVIVAGLLVGTSECIGAGYIDPLTGGGFRDVAPFILMIIVIIFRPYGLFGWRRIERV